MALRLLSAFLIASFVPALSADEKADLLALGQQQYAACVTCHGADGKGIKIGDVALAPSLHESAYLKSEDAEIASLLILKGIKKEGDTFVQQMIGLEQAMDDAQLAAVLTYTRNTFAGHDDFVSPKQVADWRKEHKGTGALVTRKHIEALSLVSGFSGRLDDLRYEAYQVNVNKLPDFRSLTPDNEGEWKSGVLDIAAAGEFQKKAFALVFEGNLVVPKTGTYQFLLGSDDGSRLIVDGEAEIDNDGVHGMKVKESKPQELVEGIHSIRVEYFEKGGNKELALSLKVPGTDVLLPLSKQKIGGKGGTKPPATPIPLLARNPEEAILYRNFISDSQPRGIAVGYPGGGNLCWDADTYNLVHVWQGAFMDASRHWNGRGQGNQPPMGVDVAIPAKGLPLQVLASPDTPWVDLSQAKIKYDRDQAVHTREITYNSPHPDYKFLGYRLNEKRYPTFRFQFEEMNVEDFFQPQGVGSEPGTPASMVRTLRFSGKPSAHTHYRVAKGGAEADDGAIDINGLLVTVEGAELTKHGGSWVFPVAADSEVIVTYRWK